jgi:hypothetical protein
VLTINAQKIGVSLLFLIDELKIKKPAPITEAGFSSRLKEATINAAPRSYT